VLSEKSKTLDRSSPDAELLLHRRANALHYQDGRGRLQSYRQHDPANEICCHPREFPGEWISVPCEVTRIHLKPLRRSGLCGANSFVSIKTVRKTAERVSAKVQERGLGLPILLLSGGFVIWGRAAIWRAREKIVSRKDAKAGKGRQGKIDELLFACLPAAGKLAFRRAYEFCLAETTICGVTLHQRRLPHSHPGEKDLFLSLRGRRLRQDKDPWPRRYQQEGWLSVGPTPYFYHQAAVEKMIRSRKPA